MKEYFITVMAVAFFGGTIITLVPLGNTTKYVRLLCGLCTVCSIAFPLVSFVGGNFEKEDLLSIFDYEGKEESYYEEIYNNCLTDTEINNAEITLKNEIIKGISASEDDFSLNIITEENSGEISIVRVEVIIYSSGMSIDPRRIESCVFERLGCGCEFFYDI